LFVLSGSFDLLADMFIFIGWVFLWACDTRAFHFTKTYA
jgi:hypothetical protein